MRISQYANDGWSTMMPFYVSRFIICFMMRRMGGFASFLRDEYTERCACGGQFFQCITSGSKSSGTLLVRFSCVVFWLGCRFFLLIFIAACGGFIVSLLWCYEGIYFIAFYRITARGRGF